MHVRFTPGPRPALALASLSLILACGGTSRKPSAPQVQTQRGPMDRQQSGALPLPTALPGVVPLRALWQHRAFARQERYEAGKEDPAAGSRFEHFYTVQETGLPATDLLKVQYCENHHEDAAMLIRITYGEDGRPERIEAGGEEYAVTEAARTPRFGRLDDAKTGQGRLFRAVRDGEELLGTWKLTAAGGTRTLTQELANAKSGFLFRVAYALDLKDQPTACTVTTCDGAGCATRRIRLPFAQRKVEVPQDAALNLIPLKDALKGKVRTWALADMPGSFSLGMEQKGLIQRTTLGVGDQATRITERWTGPDAGQGSAKWRFEIQASAARASMASVNLIKLPDLPDSVKVGETGTAAEAMLEGGERLTLTYRAEATPEGTLHLHLLWKSDRGGNPIATTFDLDEKGALLGGKVAFTMDDSTGKVVQARF